MTTTPPQTQGAPEALLPDPAIPYKKGLRKVILRVFIAMVLLFAIGGAITVVNEVVFGVSAPQGLFDWLAYLPLLLAAPVFLLVLGKKPHPGNLTTVNERMKVPDFAGMLVLVVGLMAVAGYVPEVLDRILQAVGLSMPSGGLPSLATSPVAILFIVVIGPICEEIMFRGAVLRALQPYGANLAIVISALLFGLTHGHLFQAAGAFFTGLVLAYCTLHFSIKWAMLIHIINNGLSVVLISGTLALIIQGAFIVLAVVAFILGFKKFRQQCKEGKAPELPHPTEPGAVLASPRPFAIAFTSPWFIILLLVLVFQSLFLLLASPPL
jgi:membrane protease YdiL (CAAX protease family)